jgi:hypothetical protein
MTETFEEWRLRISRQALETQQRARQRVARQAVRAWRLDRWEQRMRMVVESLMIGCVLLVLYVGVTYCMELVQGVR